MPASILMTSRLGVETKRIRWNCPLYCPYCDLHTVYVTAIDIRCLICMAKWRKSNGSTACGKSAAGKVVAG
jgi:transposase-like protein